MTQVMPAPFTAEEATAAWESWGMNCGPGAIAAILNMKPEALRPHLGEFEKKGYTNPTLMFRILHDLKVKFETHYIAVSDRLQMGPHIQWPDYGLARVQWEGPWMKPGVPVRARYRHTHWVAAAGGLIFDINAMAAGGWITKEVWAQQLVPWLLKECQPRADGNWHLTHIIEIFNDRRPK